MVETTYQQARQHFLWPGGENTQRGVYEGGSLPATKLLRERLEISGVASLSLAELLTVALRTGTLQQRVTEYMQTLLTSYSLPELLQIDFGELKQQVGKGRAVQLQALLELARRLTLPSIAKRTKITRPKDAADLVMADLTFLDHEELRVLVLDTKNCVVANLLLYQGTVNSSVVRTAEIFRPAITRKCPGVIVCHSHPSGDPTPSPEDYSATTIWAGAAKLLEIDLLDHIIIGGHRFVSLKERLRWE